jgi:hypothetical protein
MGPGSRRIVVSIYRFGARSAGWFAAVGLLLISAGAAAEIIHFKNGDMLHGTVVDANVRRVTLETAYGKLTIPKKDIQRIEYESGEPEETTEKTPPTSATKPAETKAEADLPIVGASRSTVSLDIRGRAFWYAFESPPDSPTDLSIRLRIFIGENDAVALLDSKPDTFDSNTYYNSFTFSPTDSQVVRTAEDYSCEVKEAEDGRVVLTLALPEKQRGGQLLVRMLYQINEGSRSIPRWIDAVSRSFSVGIEPGKESYVVLEQDASGLDYTGFFRKSMKNIETFRLNVLSAEVRDRS